MNNSCYHHYSVWALLSTDHTVQNIYDMYAHGSPGDEQKRDTFYWDEIIENMVSNTKQNLINKAN